MSFRFRSFGPLAWGEVPNLAAVSDEHLDVLQDVDVLWLQGGNSIHGLADFM